MPHVGSCITDSKANLLKANLVGPYQPNEVKRGLKAALAALMAFVTMSSGAPPSFSGNQSESLLAESAEKGLAEKAVAEKAVAEKAVAEKTLAEKTLAEKGPSAEGGSMESAVESKLKASPEITADSSPETMEAFKIVLGGDEEKGHQVLIDAYRKRKRQNDLPADIPYFLGAFAKKHGRLKAAIGYLDEARDIFARQKTVDTLEQVLLNKRIGDCYYSMHNLKKALEEYNVALLSAKVTPDDELITSEIIESIVACHLALKQFQEAERSSNELVELCRKRAKSGRIQDMLSYSWALLQKGDLHRAAEHHDKLKKNTDEIRPLIVSLVDSRMEADARGSFPGYEEMVKELELDYIERNRPRSPAEIAWAAIDFRVRSLPVIAWKNTTASPRGAVICIHGLGLQNHAFTPFAKDLTGRGYLVYALDVRGFGSWTQTRGEESLDYPMTLDDIRTLAGIIKQRHPRIPLYIVGESMGGAIALRAGAELADMLNGVVASVPSAERFQERKMSLKTAVHFIVDPNRAFDIGSTVAERATKREDVRSIWKSDPEAKLEMTPVELIEFAVFMRRTKPHAARIKKLPVLIVQGLQDRLVKPKGSFDLFHAVKSKDKTFLTVGRAEHLMFETTSLDPVLMDALDSWLRNHGVDESESS